MVDNDDNDHHVSVLVNTLIYEELQIYFVLKYIFFVIFVAF